MLNAIAAESNAVVKAASLVPSVEKDYPNKQALIQLRVFFGSELHSSPHIHIWIRHSMYGYIWIRQYGECALYVS